MKQIAYLTMVFLPATFVAASVSFCALVTKPYPDLAHQTVFGMNVHEISPDTHGTLTLYATFAISLTVATIWIIVALQAKRFFGTQASVWQRLCWPIWLFVRRMIPLPRQGAILPVHRT